MFEKITLFFYNPAQGEVTSLLRIALSTLYYNLVNFAKGLKAPGFFTWVFSDVCPPTSMFAANNSIPPQKLLPFFDTHHWPYGEQFKLLNNWLNDQFRIK